MRAAALLPLALFAGTLGCNEVAAIGPDICDRSEEGNPAVRYTGGTVEDGIYMSSAWNRNLLYFPGGMRYEIVHDFGEIPRFWQFYLSFNEDGTESGVVSLAAGNQAELRHIDESSMQVVNGSCVAYYLLVVAGVGEPGSATDGAGGGAGDAGQ